MARSRRDGRESIPRRGSRRRHASAGTWPFIRLPMWGTTRSSATVRRSTRASSSESVLEVIRQMVEEMDPSLNNYSEIARRAGVHRNYVAGRFAAEIELAQMEVNRRYATGTAYRHSMSVASLRAERTMFQEQAQA